MAGPYSMTALREERAELAGRGARCVLETLREAGEPVAVTDMAERIIVSDKPGRTGAFSAMAGVTSAGGGDPASASESYIPSRAYVARAAHPSLMSYPGQMPDRQELECKMDPFTLATAAVSLLVPYFAKAGGKVAEKAGEAAWEKMTAIAAAVQSKLAGDPYAEQTLKRVEEEPEAGNRQAALAGILEDKIKTDASFGESLHKLVDEAKRSGAEKVITQKVIVTHATVRDVTTIGEVGGDVNVRRDQS